MPLYTHSGVYATVAPLLESAPFCTYSRFFATVHLLWNLCNCAPTPECVTVSLLWSYATVSLLWSKYHTSMCLCNPFKAFLCCIWKVYLPPACIALAMTAHPPESIMLCTHSGVCATVHLFLSLCHFTPTPAAFPLCTYSRICVTVTLIWSHTKVSLLQSTYHIAMCLCIIL
jgi:hypothetical protein